MNAAASEARLPSLRRLPPPALVALTVVVLVLFGLPIVMLLAGAFRSAPPGSAGQWTFSAVAAVYSDADTYRTLGNSVVLSASQHLVGIALGVFFAWIVARTNTPLRRLITPMMVVVFAIPNLFVAISYGLLAGSPNGLVNDLAVDLLGGRPRVVVDVYSWWGLIFVSSLKVVPVMYLLLLGPVLALNRSLEEAAVMAGSGRARTFLRIQLPLLAPVLSGLAVLGFVVGLGLLDTPLILGVPADIYVFPSRIYSYLAGGTSPRYAEASALSLLLVALILLLVLARARFLGGRDFTTLTGKSYSSERWDIGAWKWACSAAIVVFAFFALVLPAGQLLVGSLQPIFGVSDKYNLDNYRTLLEDSTAVGAIGNTLLIGVVGGFVATTLALFVAYAARRSRSRLRRLPELSVWLVVAFPGIVLGLGTVWAYLSIPVLRQLYGSLWIVLIALVVFISPTAGRAIDGAVVQIDRELEEAARISGASATRTLIGVVARLIAPAFLATWFVTGVAVAGNLDVSILLSGPGNQTVPVLTYNYYSQNGQTEQAAALLCILMAIVAALFVVGRGLYALVGAVLAHRRRRKDRPQWPADVGTGRGRRAEVIAGG